MSNVLVTGGAGFVGSYIVEQLVEEGYNVRVMDDLRTGNMKNLEKVIDKIEFCQASILDEVKLEQAMRNIETVYHLAAEVGVNRVIGRDQEVWANDYKGTVRVINKALKHGANKFMFTSTSEVYGKFDQKRLPMKENAKFEPDTIYGKAKLLSEKVVTKYARHYDMTAVSTRYFNAYGPRQTLNGYCVPHFIDAALKGEDIKIHGDGSQTRDLTYIDDAVKLTMALLDKRIKNKVKGEVFNIGTGFAISMNDLAEKIIAMTGSKSRVVYIPKRRPTDGYHKQGDATKILKVTGLKPKVSLEEGLARTIGYHKKLMAGA